MKKLKYCSIIVLIVLAAFPLVNARVISKLDKLPSVENDSDKSLAWSPSNSNKEMMARLVLLEDPADDDNQNRQEKPAPAGAKNYTPVVFWHGMGDTAYGSINIDRLALERKFPGMKVFSIQIGKSLVEDELAGYFVNVNQQIEQACQAILDNQLIKSSGALNAIGFSQGGQFMRALVQRCPLREHGIKVKNLISLGGQHQGVFGLPNCYTTVWCDHIRHLLSTAAYENYVQEHLVQAEYWHDPLHEDEYKKKNVFLPDVNNENQVNVTYKNNLLALENLVLVKFAQDEMVVPRDSSLFAFYEPGQNVAIRPLEKSALWLEDRLGLRQLDESGRLKRITVQGEHLHYRMSWFLEEIAAKYLDN